jgi:hypothetical protein
LSRAIRDALRDPPGFADWPATQIKTASACKLGGFELEGHAYVLSGGVAPLPARWATSDPGTPLFYLVRGSSGGRRISGAKQLYFLAVAGEGARFVLNAYDEAPSDTKLKADIVELFEGPGPGLAAYDQEGDAVTLLRASGIQAIILGPTPNGGHVATIYGADGHYFLPDSRFDLRMRGSGMPCPAELSGLRRGKLFIAVGADEGLDLACQYDADGVRLTLFATKASDSGMGAAFREAVDDQLADYKQPVPVKAIRPTGGTGEFAYGEAWSGSDQRNGGMWMGMRHGYRIEVRIDWRANQAESASNALGLLEGLTFDKSEKP